MYQVTYERMRFVLCQDANPSNAGIDAVREGEINDPIFSAEVQTRFGTPGCQFPEPGALSTCKNQSQRVACQSTDMTNIFIILFIRHLRLSVSRQKPVTPQRRKSVA